MDETISHDTNGQCKPRGMVCRKTVTYICDVPNPAERRHNPNPRQKCQDFGRTQYFTKHQKQADQQQNKFNLYQSSRYQASRLDWNPLNRMSYQKGEKDFGEGPVSHLAKVILVTTNH